MLINKVFGLNIMLICFGISAILYTIFEYVIPKIMDIKTTAKIDARYEDIKELSETIKKIKRELYNTISKFHTLEERTKLANKVREIINIWNSNNISNNEEIY